MVIFEPFVPIKEWKCYNCSQIGHLAAQCRKSKFKVASIQVSEDNKPMSVGLPDSTEVEPRIHAAQNGDEHPQSRLVKQM